MDKIVLITSYFLVFLVTGFCQTTESNEPCQTKYYNGTCITLTACPSAMALIRIKDVATLKRILCGFDNLNPKVCCRLDESGDTIVFNNRTETATSRPIVTTLAKSEVTTPTKPEVTTPTKPEVTTPAKPEEFITAKREEFITAKPQEIITAKSQESTTIPEQVREKSSDPFPGRKVCGQVKLTDKIVGGAIADINEFPWIARINYLNADGSNMFGCAASLITDRYLVTAAHCVLKDSLLKPESVRLGEWDEQTEKDCNDDYCNDNPPVDIKISQIIRHPLYSKETRTQHDIALLKLESPVTFTNFIQPVCLPTTEYIMMQDYVRDSAYWVAGWGVTEFGTSSSIKRKVMLEAVPTNVCRGILKYIPETSFQSLICAGGRLGKDSCKGDSGGPLVREVMENYQVNWYLFGVTSLGASACGTEGVPGVYTRVIRYMDWIRETVSN